MSLDGFDFEPGKSDKFRFCKLNLSHRTDGAAGAKVKHVIGVLALSSK